MRVETSTVYEGGDILAKARVGMRLLTECGLTVAGLQAEGPWLVPGISQAITFGAGGVPVAPVAAAGTCYARTTGGGQLAPVTGSRLRLVLELDAVRVLDEPTAGEPPIEGECETVEDDGDGIPAGEPRY